MQEAVSILIGCRRRFKFTIRERFNHKWAEEKDSGCHIWSACTRSPEGYGAFGIERGGKMINVNAHRLSWELNRGPIPPGLCVLHKCDRKRCVNPEHLWLGTLGDNNRDRALKGRSNPPLGEKCGKAKLTRGAVLSIRVSTGSNRKCAKAFGVSHSAIQSVRSGRTWGHVP